MGGDAEATSRCWKAKREDGGGCGEKGVTNRGKGGKTRLARKGKWKLNTEECHWMRDENRHEEGF